MAEYAVSVHVCGNSKEMEATRDGVAAILNGLGRNIRQHLGYTELGKVIRAFARDEAGAVVGGISADVFGGWAHVEFLWVEEALRRRGLGARLLATVEAEAIRLGCRRAHLETFSFEARPFYERHGYEVFATLDDYPAGHRKYYLRKTLAG